MATLALASVVGCGGNDESAQRTAAAAVKKPPTKTATRASAGKASGVMGAALVIRLGRLIERGVSPADRRFEKEKFSLDLDCELASNPTLNPQVQAEVMRASCQHIRLAVRANTRRLVEHAQAARAKAEARLAIRYAQEAVRESHGG
jgi:hypothetical protein